MLSYSKSFTYAPMSAIYRFQGQCWPETRWVDVAGSPLATDLLHVDHHEAIHFGILLLWTMAR